MGRRGREAQRICERLEVPDVRLVEIESKWRVLPEQAPALRERLLRLRGVRHLRSRTYFDQFLDTPAMDLLRAGASLRLRYRADGTGVKLQYKGPGYRSGGLLIRSEVSSRTLEHVIHEESHHDIVHFTNTSVPEILAEHAEDLMPAVMRRHLGAGRIAQVTTGPILSVYQKEKFQVDLGDASLEPSLDRVYAFLISRSGLHPLTTFWEYENEVKAESGDLVEKLRHLGDLAEFDEELSGRFDLKPERLDKYRRCASSFLPLVTRLERAPRRPPLHRALLSL